jgi:hypothetical protein
LVKEIGWLIVRSVPARKIAPPPLWEKAPEIEVLAPAFKVSAPVFTIATGPKLVVIRFPLREKLFPVRAIPPTALVVRFPSEVRPVPAD